MLLAALCLALPTLCQAQSPVTGSPVTGSPVTGSPVTGPPATGAPVAEVSEASLKDVSTSGPTSEPDEADETAQVGATEPTENQTFQLALEHHPWARFQPGAWREVQTITETFDASGTFVNRNVTTQKEVLQAVAEGKYVLRLQATVDLVGKRIVGAWKTRVLYLATDSVEPMKSSRQLDNQLFPLAGATAECQVWQMGYSDGTRDLRDRIHYAPDRFPFVLKRQTFVVDDMPESTTQAKAKQVVEATDVEVPYLVGDELRSCCFQRTIRHRAKGNTIERAIRSDAVPGGEVAVWTTDFNLEGKRVGWSAMTLLAYGEEDASEEPPSEP